MAANANFFDGIKDAFKAGGTVLNSNEKIMGAWDNLGGAIEVGRRIYKDKDSVGNALIRTFAKDSETAERVIKANKQIADGVKDVKKEKLELNAGKIAGSYIGLSAGMRIATGGGLYQDKNGNTNIMGIPFI